MSRHAVRRCAGRSPTSREPMVRRLPTALIAVALIVPTTLPSAEPAHAAEPDALATPVERARAIVAQMTLDEKITQLHGIRDDEKDIYRHVPGIPRLGIPDFLPTNGPAGVSTGGSRRPENQ